MTPDPAPTKPELHPAWLWVTRVILLVLVGGFAWWLVRSAIRDPSWFVRWAATLVALCSLGLLAARFQRVEDWMNAGLSGYFRLTAWVLVILLSLVVARWLSDFVARSSLAFALGALLIWSAVFCLVLRGLSTEPRRDRVWQRLSRAGPAAPFVYVFVVTLVAIVLFSTLAFVLVDRELVHFGTEKSVVTIAEPGDALDFFVWHTLDSIPALEITGTLRWEEPLAYDDPGVGLLLLIFKLVVIAPIVAAFVSFWRYRRKLTANQRPADQSLPSA